MRALAATLLLLGLLALAGCGGDSDETTATTNLGFTDGLSGQERQVAAAVEEYVVAFQAGDVERICELTSRTEAAQSNCEETLPEFKPRGLPRFELGKVVVSGRHARTRLIAQDGQGSPTLVRLVRVDGDWKILVVSLPTG